MAATTSTSCSGFWTSHRPAGQRARATSPASCGGKLDGVAAWLINGVASAFFASLERCSCIRVTTVEDGEDFNEMPLILNDGSTRDHHDGSSSGGIRRRRGGRTKKGHGHDAGHVIINEG
uniref:Uncharacterized protein n=1 Tax=Opuntia streptacantha TaxID=393608 RepID=A0A7C8Z157_OPUST